jgi:hypothetical protein
MRSITWAPWASRAQLAISSARSSVGVAMRMERAVLASRKMRTWRAACVAVVAEVDFDDDEVAAELVGLGALAGSVGSVAAVNAAVEAERVLRDELGAEVIADAVDGELMRDRALAERESR